MVIFNTFRLNSVLQYREMSSTYRYYKMRTFPTSQITKPSSLDSMAFFFSKVRNQRYFNTFLPPPASPNRVFPSVLTFPLLQSCLNHPCIPSGPDGYDMGSHTHNSLYPWCQVHGMLLPLLSFDSWSIISIAFLWEGAHNCWAPLFCFWFLSSFYHPMGSGWP